MTYETDNVVRIIFLDYLIMGVGRFAGMESLPGGEFPEQFPPPDHLVLPRPSSPEFTFGDAPPPLHPEGLVW